MAYEPPVAVYDACVLYPFHLRNLLVQCAADRLVSARWSEAIHEEWMRNLAAKNPALPPGALTRTHKLLNKLLPEANLEGYEGYIETVKLKDLDDRHAVAAGIAAGASLIATWNVRDFPAGELARHGLRPQTPDALPMDLYAVIPDVTVAVAADARRNLTKSGLEALEFVQALDRQGLRRFAAVLNGRLRDL